MRNLAIVIPTFNEYENIEKLLIDIRNNIPNCYIFVIDDSPKDNIRDLVKYNSKNNTYIHRLNHKGRGSAVLHGLNEALISKNNFDLFIEMDADFSHNPNQLKDLINYFQINKVDLLIASRYMKGSKIINWSISRRVLSFLANKLAYILLRVPVSDYTNGYRLYSKRAVHEIVRRCGKIGDGFIVLSEILKVISKKNYKINQVPTIFINRERGKSNVSVNLVVNSLFGLIKLFLKK
tara:strand:+ start:683 stop:1390 length:708 start_codon:yes stop_codon:yes gene_type:complete